KELLLQGEKLGIVANQKVGINFDVHASVHKAKKADARRSVFHAIVLFQRGAQFLQGVADVVGSEVVAQANGLAEEDFVALSEIFEDRGGYRAVRNGDDGALLGAQLGGTEADVFHSASLIANTAGVADLQSLVGQDRDSAKQIFKG